MKGILKIELSITNEVDRYKMWAIVFSRINVGLNFRFLGVFNTQSLLLGWIHLHFCKTYDLWYCSCWYGCVGYAGVICLIYLQVFVFFMLQFQLIVSIHYVFFMVKVIYYILWVNMYMGITILF